ncbi:MAG: PEP-CTERM sorting domain-containing protein [Planctomycetota bacterium]
MAAPVCEYVPMFLSMNGETEMKKAFALTAIAGLATVASAQSILFAVDGAVVAPGTEIEPTDGQTFQIDVVLDATGYGGAFFAWHQYNFNVAANLNPAGVSGNLDESDFLETADTTASPAIAGPWTGGRRPGAFPGSASNNGGSRFGGDLGNVVDASGITGPAGTIGGRQQAPAAPENNSLINSNTVYEAYRFSYTWSEDDGRVDFSLADVTLNVYPQLGAFNEFVDAAEVGSFSLVPAPATAALLGLGGFAAARRRRA